MRTHQIPVIDYQAMVARDPGTKDAMIHAAGEIGFFTLVNTPLDRDRISHVIETYRAFFHQPDAIKETVDMARTGANRGWGAPHAEQVDPNANPDFKQVFDCGYQLRPGDPIRAENLAVYADNLWPDSDSGFRQIVEAYYADAMQVAREVLSGVAWATGRDENYFTDKFSRPMALLRGNYYPPRAADAGENDFGIAEHTDYGCLTLLATDGAPGLEVAVRDGDWIPVQAGPGQFVINFGEMLEMWTAGDVRATPHRVIGGTGERISVPLFFNPNHDADVAPVGMGQTIAAGEHLSKRFKETYLHLKDRP